MRLHQVVFLAVLSSSSSSFLFGCAPDDAGDHAEALAPAPAPAANAPAPSSDEAAASMPAYLKMPATSTFMTGVEMGTPFDSIVDAPSIGATSAIAPGFAVEEVPGQLKAQATIRRIETTEDLYSALEVSASLDVEGALWGASASMSFARERKLHSEYLYVFVDASASGRTQRIAKPALTEEAKELGPKAFYERFGDRYASALVMGQEVYGLIEIRTRSLEEKERLALSLGVSYGASSFNAGFKSALETATSNVEKHVWAGALGTTMPITDDIDAFIDAVDAKFTELTSAKTDPGTQTLSFRYSSYYGMDGYPGVPKDVEAKVAEHAGVASDFLLYRSLLSDYTQRGYDVAEPTLAGMKTYATSLEGYLSESLKTSPTLPARPSVAPNSKLESFAKISKATYPGHTFVVHAYENGFVPKKLADYEIPLRYTREGVRNGITFAPIDVNRPISAYATPTPSALELWTVRRDTPTGAKDCLAYRFGDGASYFLADVTTNGAIDPAAIAVELDHDELTNFGDTSKQTGKNLVFVNEASGMVITRLAAGSGDLAQARLTAGQAEYPRQWWQQSTTSAPWVGSFAGVVDAGKAADQRWLFGVDMGPWNVGYNSADPGMVIHQWGFDLDNAQLFTIEDAGGGFRTIVTPTGGGVISVDPTCKTVGCKDAHLAAGQPIVQLPLDPATNRPGAHQRWRIVPQERVEEIR